MRAGKTQFTCEGDLLPSFGTKVSMISDERKGKRHVEEQALGSRDDQSLEAAGGGAAGGGCGAGSGRVEAHDLCLEGRVRRDGHEPCSGGETVV